jgi:hypothetical protein
LKNNKKKCRRHNERKQGRSYTLGKGLQWENNRRKIGERRVRNWEEVGGDGERESKDKVENAEGKRLMNRSKKMDGRY